MPGFNPEKINIHDLTVEEPEKAESPSEIFDPERDLSNDDWTDMRDDFLKDMEGCEHVGEKISCLDTAVTLKLLFPERAEELNLGEDLYMMLRETYNTEMRVEYTSDALEKIKILFPEKFEKPDFNDAWGKVKWENMQDELNTERRDVLTEDYPATTKFSTLAVKMKIILPEKAGEFGLNNDVAGKILKFINGERKGNAWYNFLQNASNFKILYPEKSDELKLDADFWEKAKKEFRGDCGGMRPAYFAEYLKILAAERVDVTDKGLEFTMPKIDKLSQETQEMPEQRNF